MKIIERLESNVRSYCRAFPVVFDRAHGSQLVDLDGRAYLDFFAGAGALNYGHDNPVLREALLAYIGRGGVAHSLDMATAAKVRFLEVFERNILRPRDLRYKVMFPGPTGTNAVEAALKLARKVTGRASVVAFTNAFHGMTLGSLAVTGNGAKRGGAGVSLDRTTRMPFAGYFGADIDTLGQVAAMLGDGSSGIDAPAAFIVETVQAEGGVNVASEEWLIGLARLAREHDALLIVDDIQVGCGRTGSFFSFEDAGIHPDIVCLSKSLSGFGLPLALTLMRPDIDVWEPGEHNGTFRGNNHAFVTAAAALEHYWTDDALTGDVEDKGALIRERLTAMAAPYAAEVRGRGMIAGIAFENPSIAGLASRAAFEQGLVIETAGPEGEVLKVLPALTIAHAELQRGLDIAADAIRTAFDRAPSAGANGHAPTAAGVRS